MDSQFDLFSIAGEEAKQANAPLAARLRPRTLDEYIGQSHILGEGKLLRRSIEADRVQSLILYGPPGTGKTTLARVIAGSTKSYFTDLNAVTSGVNDIRHVVQEAKSRMDMYQQRTTLFIDEIHRFNKAQQDALLPYVEDGTIILIGATTENPFFEVNAALLSRSQIFQLNPLTEEELRQIVQIGLHDRERGFGNLTIQIDEEAIAHLLRFSEGDARRLLNALELAIITTPLQENGEIHITLDTAVESIQRRAVRYDKSGDNHYDTISAFIKSIRGSDPDAAVYWLARMIDAGEDPKFIARRLVIHASEDIGNADPVALQVAVAAFHAVDFVGLPEARLSLAQATTYLASAPKSNASYRAINDALAYVRENGHGDVPAHLKDASYKGAKKLGHGVGYLYPHDYPGAFVDQRYLPVGVDMRFYDPVYRGYEKTIKAYLDLIGGKKKEGEK